MVRLTSLYLLVRIRSFWKKKFSSSWNRRFEWVWRVTKRQVHHGISCYIMVYYGFSGYIIVYHVISWYIMENHGISWYIMFIMVNQRMGQNIIVWGSKSYFIIMDKYKSQGIDRLKNFRHHLLREADLSEAKG